jgi:hypothetical protein
VVVDEAAAGVAAGFAVVVEASGGFNVAEVGFDSGPLREAEAGLTSVGVGATAPVDLLPEVAALVDVVIPVEAAPSTGGEDDALLPGPNQASPPAAPAPTSTPSMARKLRRLTRVSLTVGDGSSHLHERFDYLHPPDRFGTFAPGRRGDRRPKLAGSLKDRAVFIYYFAQLHRPFEKVEDQVCRLLGDLTGWADAAYRDGEDLRARVGVGGKRPVIAKTVTLDVGRPVRSPHQTTIPLSWKATGAPGLFPQMNADLTIARLGPEMAQLGFSGSYEAPGGPVGHAIDAALLHRIAEASVKSFVDRIADAVGNGAEQAAVSG